jgi:hypothetical protein
MLSQIEESATKSTYKLGVGFERCEDKCVKSAPKFVPSSNYHKEEETIKSTKTHYPSSPKLSFNPKREVRKESNKPREEAFIYMFCGRAGHWDEFASVARESRRGVLIMLETHIVMSSLIFYLILILVLRPGSFMDLNHHSMVLVHERTPLFPDALVMVHILNAVIVSCVGLVFLLEGLTLTLSPDTWMVHIFPVVVHVPLVQMVKCNEL